MSLTLAGLVAVVERVRATPKKGEKVALIADLLRSAHGREAELVALYLSGSLPQGRIGVGHRTLQGAWQPGPGVGPPPTLLELDAGLAALAAESAGAGSSERRARRLRELFLRTDEAGRRFLGELLLGELRQGALEGLVLEAVARASGLPAHDVRQAAMFAASVGEVARAALEEGAAALARFSLRLLSPVAPMLASPAGDEVRVFTRQLQDVTARVPELVEWARALPARELVLEGEAIALRADGRPQPFQLTMRRLGRSKDVEAARREMPLSWFFFDCLYLESEGALVGAPYVDRVERLTRSVPPGALLPRLVTGDAAQAEAFLERALGEGHEGLMAKGLAAPYVAGQRGFHWMKLKTAHTLDLVVLAVEWGSGRRKGWLSNLHLGARDAESGRFVMLGKTFKGLTDAMLRWQTERLLSLESSRDDWVVHVRPELVVEVAFSDVQESPRYPAGLALRFARVKRHRPDKPASEADTLQAVHAIFERQRA